MPWIWSLEHLSRTDALKQLGITPGEFDRADIEPDWTGPNPRGGKQRLYLVSDLEEVFGLEPGTLRVRAPRGWAIVDGVHQGAEGE